MLTPQELDTLFDPLTAHARVALAVSGGSDSMALMLLAREWSRTQPKAPELVALTVDHALREEARREAEWVGQQAGAIGLPHHILTWKNARSEASQAEAREARYSLMADFARAHGIGAIVTAHTSDDVAETFLMRLARGSGVDGLAEMARETAWSGIPIVRPLLDLSRAQLRAELEARGAGWIEDPSNAEERFERIRVRRALETLTDLGIARPQIVESAGRLRRARDAIDAAARAFVASRCELGNAGYARLPGDVFASVPCEVAIHALKHLLTAVGGCARPPRLRKLEALAEQAARGQRFTATLGGCVISLDPGCAVLTICREPGRLDAEPAMLAPGETAIWDGRFRVEARPGMAGTIRVDALGEDNVSRLPENIRWDHPRAALASLPAIYDDATLLGVPVPGFALQEQRFDAAECEAAFIWNPGDTHHA